MGLFIIRLDKRSTLKLPEKWLKDYFGGSKSLTGVSVNDNKMLSLSAVYASVRLISETIASLPFPVYQKTENGKVRAEDHPLYKILHTQCNPEQTSFSFRKTIVSHVLLKGNGYAEIEYDANGDIKSLWLLPPDRVTKFRKTNGDIAYKINLPNGGQVELPDWKVFHIFGMSRDGLTGIAPLEFAKEMFGLGIALEQHASLFFGNGAKPSIVVETPNGLSDPARERLKKDFDKLQGGLTNAYRTAFLEEGMSIKQLTLPHDQAQFIESRKFTVEEIARFFNVPPHMIQSLDKATFSNIEHQAIQFVVHSIRPWLVNIEQEARRSLLFTERDQKYIAEFIVEGLLRGDSKAKGEYYKMMRETGAFSINDILELENRNTIGPSGDIRYVPLNMIPIEQSLTDFKESKQEEGRSVETRSFLQHTQRQNIELRKSTTKSYKTIIEEAFTRIYKREEADIMRQAKKMLGKRDSEQFLFWLSDFYRQHEEFTEKQLITVFRSLAEAITIHAASEIGTTGSVTPELDEFILAYIGALRSRHIGASISMLRNVVEGSLKSGSDVVSSLQSEFDNWYTSRLSSVANEETVRYSNAITRETYLQNGVNEIEWIADSDPCEFCQHFDGMVINIQNNFINKDQEVEVNGNSFKPSRNIKHPSLHSGCECTISAKL
mgnify:CR=1 FL=1